MRLLPRLTLRIGHVAGQAHVRRAALDPDQAVAQLAAEERRDAFAPAVDGRQIVDDAIVVPQRQVNVADRPARCG